MDIRYLKADTVIEINREQIERYTPDEPIGLRDRNALESALHRGQMLHYYEQTDDIFRIAAAIGHGITKAHAFLNANKRTAAHVTLQMLLLNGYLVNLQSSKNLVDTFEGMAKDDICQDKFAAWLRQNSIEFLLDEEIKSKLLT